MALLLIVFNQNQLVFIVTKALIAPFQLGLLFFFLSWSNLQLLQIFQTLVVTSILLLVH